jgi:hypothetical protein
MAEGGHEIEFDNPAFDVDDPDYEEGFGVDDPDYEEIWETSNTSPAWALGEDVPAGVYESELATPLETEALVGRWESERSKYGLQAHLVFRSSRKGDLWVQWGKDWKLLTWKNTPGKFLSPNSIQRYGIQLARALGVTSERGSMSAEAAAKLQGSMEQLPDNVAEIPLADLSAYADRAQEVVTEITTELTEEEEAALRTLDNPPLETGGLSFSVRELRGLDEALRRTRGELVNNLAKLTELDDHIGLEEGKLRRLEDDDTLSPEDKEASSRRIRDRLRSLADERAARVEVLSANREDLRSQISRIRETVLRLLHEDKTLAERIRTLFREQGVNITSILTALGFAVSTLILTLTGRDGVPAPTPAPSDKGGLKEWVKKHLRALGSALAKLAGKAAAALPGIIGSIVSWLLGLRARTAGWLADNLWAMVLAVGGLLLMAARDLAGQP